MRTGTLAGDPPGFWTDDTAMAVGILRVAAAGHRLDQVAGQRLVGREFLAWFATRPPDVGVQTAVVLAQAAVDGDCHAAAAAYAARHEKSAGNGSLMRTGPVALRHLGDDAALVAAATGVSAVTHADPLATEACVLWTIAIDRAVRLGSLEGPAAGLHLLAAERQAFWSDVLAAAEAGPVGRFTPNGFVVTALQAAWAAVFRAKAAADPFDEGVRLAISIGNDTDTVGAIAGALLGAAVGERGIPTDFVDAIRGYPDDLSAPGLRLLASQAISH